MNASMLVGAITISAAALAFVEIRLICGGQSSRIASKPETSKFGIFPAAESSKV
jgi:hypothetical protein